MNCGITVSVNIYGGFVAVTLTIATCYKTDIILFHHGCTFLCHSPNKLAKSLANVWKKNGIQRNKKEAPLGASFASQNLVRSVYASPSCQRV